MATRVKMQALCPAFDVARHGSRKLCRIDEVELHSKIEMGAKMARNQLFRGVKATVSHSHHSIGIDDSDARTRRSKYGLSIALSYQTITR